MSRAVLISVRHHEGRYHGAGDGPPSPARLFQALVAGAGLSGPLAPEASDALKWLEQREPPIIACPRMADGQSIKNYVPNNDLDAVGGDPRRVGEIRTEKSTKARFFDAEVPFQFAWAIQDNEEDSHQAQAICLLAERLYQFGRGIDMAWAWGDILDAEELDKVLAHYPGVIHRPATSGGGKTLTCPRSGSLASLENRYRAIGHRFEAVGKGKATKQLFYQPPKPRFSEIAYESPPARRVYELRQGSEETPFGAWPLARASQLVELLRDLAAEKLGKATPDRISEIERVMIGRKANGADSSPTALRLRIVPLPSIGHSHADHKIRRVLIEVPAGCTLRADDVNWAFSGLEIAQLGAGNDWSLTITPSADERMLAHYGIGVGRFRTWHTVTAAALPDAASRRRIDPKHIAAEAKGGAERAAEQTRAAAAVVQALRHAEVRSRPQVIRVQREPFEAHGERVDAFAPVTRFAKERLWHVEITFDAPLTGPLIIGDGRFLGLGVMAPVRQSE